MWTVAAPKGQIVTNLKSHSPVQIAKFVWVGLEATFGGLGQLPGVGILLLILLVVGLFFAFRDRPKSRRLFAQGRAAPVALMIGAVLFLLMTATARAGQGGLLVLLKTTGPDRARESRYIYLIAAMLLPAIGLASEALIRRKKLLTIPIVVVLLAGLPANINQLHDYSPRYATPPGTRYAIVSLSRLPHAYQLRNTHTPYPDSRLSVEGLTVSWLIDSGDRIPNPGPIKPGVSAAEELEFFVQPATPGPNLVCHPLTRPLIFEIKRHQTFTIERGYANVKYLPVGPGTAPSTYRAFPAQTYRALVGPLRLRFFPLDKGVDVCL